VADGAPLPVFILLCEAISVSFNFFLCIWSGAAGAPAAGAPGTGIGIGIGIGTNPNPNPNPNPDVLAPGALVHGAPVVLYPAFVSRPKEVPLYRARQLVN
jgi:hypothetical protein